jgi:hypothetical protein
MNRWLSITLVLPRKSLHLLSLVCGHGQMWEWISHISGSMLLVASAQKTSDKRMLIIQSPFILSSSLWSCISWLIILYIFRAVWSHIPLKQDFLLQQVLGLIPWPLLLLLWCVNWSFTDSCYWVHSSFLSCILWINGA